MIEAIEIRLSRGSGRRQIEKSTMPRVLSSPVGGIHSNASRYRRCPMKHCPVETVTPWRPTGPEELRLGRRQVGVVNLPVAGPAEIGTTRWAVAYAQKILTGCRIGPPPFVESVEGGRRVTASKEET
jgi:hypothetical protein